MLEHYVPPYDATAVARLERAGAVIVGKTNCDEFAMGSSNENSAFGPVRNPWALDRIPGGTSGGSAAAVAAGMAPLALGSDTGGSIRQPASLCGVVGLKPTYGLVPAEGVFPLSPSLDHAGTLTATAADGIALLQAIAGELPLAPVVRRTATSASGNGTPVIGLLSAQLADPSVTSEVGLALRSALDRLAAAGWEMREIGDPWLAELPRWEEALAVIVAREAAASHAGRDTSQYAEGTRALLAFGAAVTDVEYARAQAARDELTAAVSASLTGVDALAGPTVGYTAPEQDPPFGVGDDNAEGRFTGPYNLTGHPAVSVPVPAPGLPVGLQLAGAHGGDVSVLELAGAAQRLLFA
jgi:aspartyl-tRNA(Asn)/glutamyl-tRNA(Gln) amidotransferase subunit A